MLSGRLSVACEARATGTASQHQPSLVLNHGGPRSCPAHRQHPGTVAAARGRDVALRRHSNAPQQSRPEYVGHMMHVPSTAEIARHPGVVRGPVPRRAAPRLLWLTPGCSPPPGCRRGQCLAARALRRLRMSRRASAPRRVVLIIGAPLQMGKKRARVESDDTPRPHKLPRRESASVRPAAWMPSPFPPSNACCAGRGVARNRRAR